MYVILLFRFGQGRHIEGDSCIVKLHHLLVNSSKGKGFRLCGKVQVMHSAWQHDALLRAII